MSSFALPKSLYAATWVNQTNGTDKSKDGAKTAVTNALKAVETQGKLVDLDTLDVSKLTALADIEKRADDIDATQKALDKLESLIKAANDAALKFVKLLGASPDKKVKQAADDIDKDGKAIVKSTGDDIAKAVKALAEKQKVAAAAAAKAGAAAAPPPDKKALALATSYKKLGLMAISNARFKPAVKPARFMIVEFKQQVLLYMGLKYDRKITEAAMKALNGQKHPEDPYIKTWVDPNSKVIWEKESLTLVSDKIPNKLANRLGKSTKLVLGKAYKVRMRNSKGEVAESDDKDADKVSAEDLAKELASMAPDPEADNDADVVSDDSKETAEDAKPAAAPVALDNKAAVAAQAAWAAAFKSASGEVDNLIKRIHAMFPEAEHAKQLAAADDTLKKIMGVFDGLNDQLAKVAEQKDKQAREKCIRDVLAKVVVLRQLDKHPVIANLDANEVQPIKARKTLFDGLDNVDSAMEKLTSH